MGWPLRPIIRPDRSGAWHDLLARGFLPSIPDLAPRIRAYIRQYNKQPKPIRWSYSKGHCLPWRLLVDGVLKDGLRGIHSCHEAWPE